MFLTVCGCGSVQTPTAAVAPAPPPVVATPAPVTVAPPAPARCDDDNDPCVREQLPALTRALDQAETSPRDALAALDGLTAPEAIAWRSYLAHHVHDEDAAAQALAQIEDEAMSAAPSEVTAPGARALWVIRRRAEALQSLDPDHLEHLPCAVFQWDPTDARDAFAPTYGSTRDVIIAPFKRRCVDAAVSQALGAEGVARVHNAEDAVFRALFRQWPVPEEGTLWTAVAIRARETMRDTMLRVPPPSDTAPAAARALVARLSEADRARLMIYRQATEGPTGPLTRSLCSVARARGETVSLGACESRVRAATLAAFTVWVGALRGS